MDKKYFLLITLFLISCGSGDYESSVSDSGYRLLSAVDFKPHGEIDNLEVASYSYASNDCPLELTALVYRNNAKPYVIVDGQKKWLSAVYIHGGGYVSGAPEAFENAYKSTFKYIVDQGYMFYSLSYRVSQARNPTTHAYHLLDDGSKCDVNNVEIHNDIYQGVSLMAQRHVGVPGVEELLAVKAVGFGISAGGHLAAYEGVHNQSYYRAVVAISPLLNMADLVNYLKSDNRQQAQYFSMGFDNAEAIDLIVGAYCGVKSVISEISVADLYDASINNHIAYSVPIYLLVGAQDNVLPPDHAVELCDRVAANEGVGKQMIEAVKGRKYYQCGSQHRLLLDENSGHNVPLPKQRLYDWFHPLGLPADILSLGRG